MEDFGTLAGWRIPGLWLGGGFRDFGSVEDSRTLAARSIPGLCLSRGFWDCGQVGDFGTLAGSRIPGLWLGGGIWDFGWVEDPEAVQPASAPTVNKKKPSFTQKEVFFLLTVGADCFY